MSGSYLRAAGGIILLLYGCAEQNAVLELKVDLPPAADGRMYALTQVRRADVFPFDRPWVDDRDPVPVALGAERTVDHISVETIGDDDFDLHVRVRFCVSSGCTDLADDIDAAPQVCATVEHPFYLGHQSELTLTISTIPSGPDCEDLAIGKCAVRACAGGDMSTSYCRESDDTHFCE